MFPFRQQITLMLFAVLVLAAAVFGTACGEDAPSPKPVVPLAQNIWTDGTLTKAGDSQWFRFTATVRDQYIHVDCGSLPEMVVRVYAEQTGENAGEPETFLRTNNDKQWMKRTIVKDGVYIIEVSGTPVRPDRYPAAFKIGFGNTESPPPSPLSVDGAIDLPVHTWVNGNIENNGDSQWFRFTAPPGSSQSNIHIHVDFGELRDLWVRMFAGDSGRVVGSQARLSGGTRAPVARPAADGKEYYIEVWGHTTSTGTYRIGLTTSATPPASVLPSTETPMLTRNTWVNGALAEGGRQWFRFEASAKTNYYIHVEFGDLTEAYVRLYDSDGKPAGERVSVYGGNSFASMAVESGFYYIEVYGYTENDYGTYKITFTDSDQAPPTTLPNNAALLIEDKWADGALLKGKSQWFRFQASAETNYIHANFGSLHDLSLQIYTVHDGKGHKAGVPINLYMKPGSRFDSAPVPVTDGAEYYIEVRAHNPSEFGAYKIVLSQSAAPPSAAMPGEGEYTALTKGAWAVGDIAERDGEQWFRFTASAAVHFIHLDIGSVLYAGPADPEEDDILRDAAVQVYDSVGIPVGSEEKLSALAADSGEYRMSLKVPLEDGGIYYMRVRGDDDYGAYRVAFTESSASPPVKSMPAAGVTELTEGEWTGGNIASAGANQWFRFTATAGTQSLHLKPDGLNYAYVQLYDSTGGRVGCGEMYNAALTMTKAVNAEQVYYAEVWEGWFTGTYKIAFTASSTPP